MTLQTREMPTKSLENGLINSICASYSSLQRQTARARMVMTPMVERERPARARWGECGASRVVQCSAAWCSDVCTKVQVYKFSQSEVMQLT